MLRVSVFRQLNFAQEFCPSKLFPENICSEFAQKLYPGRCCQRTLMELQSEILPEMVYFFTTPTGFLIADFSPQNKQKAPQQNAGRLESGCIYHFILPVLLGFFRKFFRKNSSKERYSLKRSAVKRPSCV